MAQMMAVTLLTRAIEYDVVGRKLEALKLYEDGIEALLKDSKGDQNCRNVKYIQLLTVKDSKNNDEQGRAFETLKESLQKQAVKFVVEYSEHMHDRQVILSNGYVVKIGRGLNYFKPSPSRYCLGAFNFHFRECRETNVDVFYCPENNKS
uniref:MIT_C domain-containing protein n=1 Tax=Anopheles atroparvus TaxID=41427 RepID=A0A182JGG9_ANOAO